MLRRNLSAVFECAIPTDDADVIAARQEGHGKRPAALDIPFPAWPEIRRREQYVCLPALSRAVYAEWHNLEPTRAYSIEEWDKLLFTQDIGIPSLQHLKGLMAYFRYHHGLVSREIFMEVLDDLGVELEEVRLLANKGTALMIENTRSRAGMKTAFAVNHEAAHHVFGLEPPPYVGACVISNAVVSLFQLIDYLVSYDLPSREMKPFFEELHRRNRNLSFYVRFFEPIEEVCANVAALEILPPNFRDAVGPRVRALMRVRNLESLYLESIEKYFLDATAFPEVTFAKEEPMREKILAQHFALRALREFKEKTNIPPDISPAGVDAMRISALPGSDRLLILTPQGTALQMRITDRARPLRPPPERPNEQQRITERRNANRNLFRESLRQQIVHRIGFRCPLDYERGEGVPCCGYRPMLEQLWRNLPTNYQKIMSLPPCFTDGAQGMPG